MSTGSTAHPGFWSAGEALIDRAAGRVLTLAEGRPRAAAMVGFLCACFLIAVLKYGIWAIPAVPEYVLMSQHIHSVAVIHDQQWNYDSFWGPFIASLLHLNRNVFVYCALNFAVLFLGFLGIGLIVQRRFGSTSSLIYGLLFAAAPASNVLLTWLGYADQWSFVLMSLSVIAGNPFIAAFAAMIMGWNHFEIGCFSIAACSAALWFVDRKRAIRWCAVSTAALIVGKLTLYLYFQLNGMELTRTRLAFIRDYGIGHMALSSTANVFLLILSSFGGLWLVIALLQRTDLDSRFRKAAIAAFLICAVAVPVVLDRTRIFAVISWPVMLVLLTNVDRTWLGLHKRQIIKAMIIAAAIPGVIVWDRTVYSSTISYDLYSAYWLLRSGTVPDNLFLGSPFGINGAVNIDAIEAPDPGD